MGATADFVLLHNFKSMHQIIDFIVHIDVHLKNIVDEYGALTYAILFLIIFAETGFVVTPFLPGDSLLFAAGAIAASTQVLNPWYMILLLSAAGILGNTVNYYIGFHFGSKLIETGKLPFVKREHLEKAEAFYAKYGAWAIVLGRFLPFIRTFVPFVAGIGKMNWKKYMVYNVIGAFTWITPFTLLGYFFGGLPFVQDNFKIIILAIIIVTVIPAALGVIQQYIKNKKEKK